MVRERWLLIAFVSIAFIGIGEHFERRLSRSYEATATIRIDSGVSNARLVGIRQPRLQENNAALTQRLSNVPLESAVQRETAKRVREMGYAKLRGSFTVSTGAGLLRVGVQSNDPTASARVANALAEAVVHQLERDEARLIARRIDAVEATAPSRREAQTDFVDFLRRLGTDADIIRLRILREGGTAAEIIRPAVPPRSPTIQNQEISGRAGIFGIGLVLVLVLLLDILDRRPRDPGRLARSAGLPLAGQIPRLGRRDAAYESYERVVASLEADAVERPPVVVLTSGAEGEGKTASCLGLAEAAARLGLRPCIVEAEPRRPVLAKAFDLGGPGLGGALSGRPLEDVLCELRVEDGAGEPPVSVAVIPAGRPDAQSARLVRPDTVEPLLERLRQRFDIVLVDTAPLAAAAEGAVFIRDADAVVVCARAGRTTLDDLETVAAAVERAGVAAPALLVTDVRRPARAAGRRSRRRRGMLGRLVPTPRRA